MNKALKTVVCATMAAMASGCATITCSSPGMLDGVTIKGTSGKPSQLVFIDATGYYFLWVFPLASSDIRWNEQSKSIEGGFSFFTDHVSLENLQKAITKYADSRDCDLVDINYHDSDSSYAGVSQSGAIGSLFGSSDMSVSAVLVPRSSVKTEISKEAEL